MKKFEYMLKFANVVNLKIFDAKKNIAFYLNFVFVTKNNNERCTYV